VTVAAKLTLTLQAVPGAIADAQVFDCVKSPGLVPTIVIRVTLIGTFPVLRSVMTRPELVPTSWSPKFSVLGIAVISGGVVNRNTTPAPLSPPW
jgi:hypothetical protein